jgi:hypothetical protein
MRSYAFVVLVPLLLLACPAGAVEPLDTFNFRVGGYATDFDTRVRADGETRDGTSIDLRRDLGLDSRNTVGLVALTWRPFSRHEFGLSYYTDDADSERRLERDIEFKDTRYTASSTVKAGFDLDAYEFNYTYWVFNRERWALGPRIGLVWYRLGMDIELDVDVDGGSAAARRHESVDADLPAPAIGAGWRWSPGEHWRLGADVGYFTADINDIDADVTYGRAGVEWLPWRRWGFWLDYTMRRIDADADTSSFTGSLRFVDSGLRVGVNYRF